ncbi:hypothetical protein DPMN_146970 [Dreissena polymorpha]|uniref:Uncharacterized protein n=1 Tax=Dreissena polymorpha TaxID=45954 RepID=A0A9D4J2J0_DREPO|nr:hypothetical protein DPMN_146970 [Dreissena polymorpha]
MAAFRETARIGIYYQLMVEFRSEDPGTFKKFLRMPTEMYDTIWEGSSSPREAPHSVQGALGFRAKVSCHTTSPGFSCIQTCSIPGGSLRIPSL